jgi:hypothetical protein
MSSRSRKSKRRDASANKQGRFIVCTVRQGRSTIIFDYFLLLPSTRPISPHAGQGDCYKQSSRLVTPHHARVRFSAAQMIIYIFCLTPIHIGMRRRASRFMPCFSCSPGWPAHSPSSRAGHNSSWHSRPCARSSPLVCSPLFR